MEPCEARLVHWENLASNTAFLFQILSSSYGENCPGRISHVTSLRALVALCVLMDAMSSWTCIFLVSQLTSNNKHSMALLLFFQYLWHYSGTISCAISFQAFLPFIPKLQDKMQNRKPGFDKYFYINWRWSLPDPWVKIRFSSFNVLSWLRNAINDLYNSHVMFWAGPTSQSFINHKAQAWILGLGKYWSLVIVSVGSQIAQCWVMNFITFPRAVSLKYLFCIMLLSSSFVAPC